MSIEIKHRITGVTIRVVDDANLRYADLRYANLRYADLRYANLRDANLRYADLRYANLRYADLRYANLRDADLSYANLRDAKGVTAPVIPNLDDAILAAVESGGKLEMGSWHSCNTTHCRAGWAIHLAGVAGCALEDRIGPSAAGALIYHASTGRVPDFFASNEDAMADIRASAAKPVEVTP
jgi:uncharacterized protein YjbI with pentapeptide repeats